MLAIFLKTMPFFGVIALGYWAGRTRFFSEDATAYLTKFVFYFALSAMLFQFAATLSLADILTARFVIAYLCASGSVYLIATAVAFLRGRPMVEAAVEAQCAVIGNVGFLGVPMLVLLMGEAAAGPVLMMLSIDLIVFSSLITIVMTLSRQGRMSGRMLGQVWLGLLKNPMIVSIALGLVWQAWKLPVPAPANEFLVLLGAAATPGALFAIGASLASKSAERVAMA
ncbi:MAG: AEC family transporter, partial [Rhodobacteraceae bacterium]|nr:AEC family transporter [Paracoccaceae bacterium]